MCLLYFPKIAQLVVEYWLPMAIVPVSNSGRVTFLLCWEITTFFFAFNYPELYILLITLQGVIFYLHLNFKLQLRNEKIMFRFLTLDKKMF